MMSETSQAHAWPLAAAELGPHELESHWPLRSFLELGALPGAVPCARLHAKLLMSEWGVEELSDNVEIVTTELVSNAIAASQSERHLLPVRLWLFTDKSRVLIAVWDTSVQPPVPIDADTDAESGRGLLLIEAVTEEWGWYPTERAGGKMVWATVAE